MVTVVEVVGVLEAIMEKVPAFPGLTDTDKDTIVDNLHAICEIMDKVSAPINKEKARQAV